MPQLFEGFRVGGVGLDQWYSPGPHPDQVGVALHTQHAAVFGVQCGGECGAESSQPDDQDCFRIDVVTVAVFAVNQ